MTAAKGGLIRIFDPVRVLKMVQLSCEMVNIWHRSENVDARLQNRLFLWNRNKYIIVISTCNGHQDPL